MFRVLSTLKGLEQRHLPIFLISVLGLFYVAGNGSVFFALPLIANSLVNDLMIVGLLIAIPNFVSLFLDVPLGGLSDYLGRKKLLGSGLFMMGLLGIVLPTISTVPALILFLVVFGIANQLIYISVRAFIMDISPLNKTSEYFGFFEALASIGFTIGPIVGGMLIADQLSIGVLSVGLFYFTMCLIALVIVFTLKETIPKEGLTSSIKDLIKKDKLIFRELIEFKELRGPGAIILILTFILVTADGLIWTMEPLFATLGLDTATVGLILAMFVVPFILFDVPAGYLADKIGKTKVMFIGLIIAGIFLISFGSTREPNLLLIFAFIATTGLALVRPSVDGLLTDLAEQKHKGGIVGVWDVSEDLGYVIGPILGGIIAEYYQNIGVAFTAMGAILLLMAPLALLTSKRKTKKEENLVITL